MWGTGSAVGVWKGCARYSSVEWTELLCVLALKTCMTLGTVTSLSLFPYSCNNENQISPSCRGTGRLLHACASLQSLLKRRLLGPLCRCPGQQPGERLSTGMLSGEADAAGPGPHREPVATVAVIHCIVFPGVTVLNSLSGFTHNSHL